MECETCSHPVIVSVGRFQGTSAVRIHPKTWMSLSNIFWLGDEARLRGVRKRRPSEQRSAAQYDIIAHNSSSRTTTDSFHTETTKSGFCWPMSSNGVEPPSLPLKWFLGQHVWCGSEMQCSTKPCLSYVPCINERTRRSPSRRTTLITGRHYDVVSARSPKSREL